MSERDVSQAATGVPLTVERAKALITAFCRDYPAAYEVAYRVRKTLEDLYGKEFKTPVSGTIKGGLRPGYVDAGGHFHRGRCDIPVANILDDQDLERTLRHELIGHFGLNTFEPDEKRAVLNALVESRNEPGLDAYWATADELYAGRPALIRAEEVYALACEAIASPPSIDAGHARQILKETCIDRSRPMQLHDLTTITHHVAAGLHDRSRTQRVFPLPGEQFRLSDDDSSPEARMSDLTTGGGGTPPADDDAVREAREAFFAGRKPSPGEDGPAAADVDQVQMRGLLAQTRLELATEREFRTWAQQDVTDLGSITDQRERERVLDVIAQHAASPEYLAALRLEADASVVKAVVERIAPPAVEGDTLPGDPGADEVRADLSPPTQQLDALNNLKFSSMPAANDVSARNPANDPERPVAQPIDPANLGRIARMRARDRDNAERQLRQAAAVDAVVAASQRARATGTEPRALTNELANAGPVAAERARGPVHAGAERAGLSASPEPSVSGPVLDRAGYEIPAGVASRYVVSDGNFWHFEGRGKAQAKDAKPHFVDSGAKLATEGSDRQTIADMVAIAKAKRWGAISVRGDEAFCRNAWLEASLAGLEVRDYKPDEADRALLQAAQRERDALRIKAGDAPAASPASAQPAKPAGNALEAAIPVGEVRQRFQDAVASYPENVRRELTTRFDARLRAGLGVQTRVNSGALPAEQFGEELGKQMSDLKTALQGEQQGAAAAPSKAVPAPSKAASATPRSARTQPKL